MICIECTQPVNTLYTSYSPSNIRLTACPKCNKFADKYIEHDGVVIFIDTLLLKPAAYRHLVFNTLAAPDGSDILNPQTRRMWILITLFDVYLTWARTENSHTSNPSTMYILSLPILAQYTTFLLLCIVESLITHLVIRFMAFAWLGWTRSNALSTAVLISSYSKIFPILMVIWSYEIPLAATLLGWAVSVNVVEALTITLNCGHLKAITITSMAALARTIVCDYCLYYLLIWTWKQVY